MTKKWRGGQEEGAVTVNPAFTPVTSFHYMLSNLLNVWFFYYQVLDLVSFSKYVEGDAAHCAALETPCVKSMTAVPFINTAYQQSVGLPTRGHESLPEWHSYRAYEQQHRKNNSPHVVECVGLSCKVDRKREHLSRPLCMCVFGPDHNSTHWDPMRNSSNLAGYFLVFFLLRVIIRPLFRETGLMCEQMQEQKLALGHLPGMIRTPYYWKLVFAVSWVTPLLCGGSTVGQTPSCSNKLEGKWSFAKIFEIQWPFIEMSDRSILCWSLKIVPQCLDRLQQSHVVGRDWSVIYSHMLSQK